MGSWVLAGVWRRSPHLPETGSLAEKPPSAGGKGFWGRSPHRWLGDFLIKITHFFAYFVQNSNLRQQLIN